MDARRLVLMLLLSVATGSSYAQAPVRTEPLPPAPGPDVLDADTEPQVTILHDDNQQTEEVRIQGQLRYVRVTPRYGRPYYLIPDVNGATYIRRDSLDPTLKVPMWTLFTF